MAPINSDSPTAKSATADIDDGLGISPDEIAEVLRATGQSPSFVGMSAQEILATRQTGVAQPPDAVPADAVPPDGPRWVEVEEQPTETATEPPVTGAETPAPAISGTAAVSPSSDPPADPFDELDEIEAQMRQPAVAPSPLAAEVPQPLPPSSRPVTAAPAASPVSEPADASPPAEPEAHAAPPAAPHTEAPAHAPSQADHADHADAPAASKIGRILAVARSVASKIPVRKIAALIAGNKFVTKAISAVMQNPLLGKLKAKALENKFVARVLQLAIVQRALDWSRHNRAASVLIGGSVAVACLAWSSAGYHAGMAAWRSSQLGGVEARVAELEQELSASHAMTATYEQTAKSESQAATELRTALEAQQQQLLAAEAEVTRLKESHTAHPAAHHGGGHHDAAHGGATEVEAALEKLAVEQRETYNLQLALAKEILTDDPGRALALLDDSTKCPSDLRDFAWHYQRSRAAHDRRTLRGHAGPVVGCAWSADGQTLVTAGTDRVLRFWNLATGGHWDHAAASVKPLLSMAITSDGGSLLTSASDQTVTFWQIGEHALTAKWTAKTSNVAAVALSPDGSLAATAGVEWPIQLWNLQSGAVEAVLIGHAGEVDGVAFSPDGFTVASIGRDGTVRWWDIATRSLKATRRLAHTSTSVDETPQWSGGGIAFSRDGKLLATSGFGSVRVWRADTGELLHDFVSPSGRTGGLTFDAHNSSLAAADGSDVTVWDLAGGEIHARRQGHVGDVRAVACSPDGLTLASAGDDGTIKLWDAEDEPHERGIARRLDDARHPASRIASGAHGDVIAVARDNTVEIWDVRRGWKVVTLPPQTGPVREVVLSPDGASVAVATDEWPVFVWGVESRRLRFALNGHVDRIGDLVYSPSGSQIATASADRTVRIWDAKTSALVATLNAHASPVTSVLFSPDEATIFSATESGHLYVWNAARHTERLMLETHHGEVVDMAIAPAGDVLAVASVDGTVSLWDASKMEQVAEFSGASDPAARIHFSADGKTLACAAGGTLTLRDPRTGRERAILDDAGSAFVDAAFARDNRQLFAVGRRGLTVWSIPERHDIDASPPVVPDQSHHDHAGPAQPHDAHAPQGESAGHDAHAPHAAEHGHDAHADEHSHAPAADAHAPAAPAEHHDAGHEAHPAPAAHDHPPATAPAHDHAAPGHDAHHGEPALH